MLWKCGEGQQFKEQKELQCVTPWLQALSNTVWAFSRLEERNLPLLTAVADQARQKINAFNAQNVANTVPASLPPCHGILPLLICNARPLAPLPSTRLQRFHPSSISSPCIAYQAPLAPTPNLPASAITRPGILAPLDSATVGTAEHALLYSHPFETCQ